MVALSTLMVPAIIFNVATAAVVARSMGLVARSCNPDPPTVANGISGTVQTINNATSVFAWHLTAITQHVGTDESSLSHVVHDIIDNLSPYVKRLNDLSMNPAVVTNMVEGRLGCGINQDTENNLVHLAKYARLYLETQLSSVFENNTKAFTVMCDNWDNQRVSQDDPLFNFVCSVSATKKPTKQIQSTPVPSSDSADLIASSSQIFALQLLSTLSSSDQVKTTCGKDWNDFAANLKLAGLNQDDFKKTFCTSNNQQSLPDTLATRGEITGQIRTLATHALAVQLFAMSGKPAYHDFLCNAANFNTRGVANVVNLDQFYNELGQRCNVISNP